LPDAITWTRVPKERRKTKRKQQNATDAERPGNSSVSGSGAAAEVEPPAWLDDVEPEPKPGDFMIFLLVIDDDQGSADLDTLATGESACRAPGRAHPCVGPLPAHLLWAAPPIESVVSLAYFVEPVLFGSGRAGVPFHHVAQGRWPQL
jgi:hypothetical protein